MSIEEKAKAYDEALEVMRQWVAPCHTKEQLDTMKKSVFPELRESEDEMTRNEIIAFIEQAIHRGGGTPISKEKEDKWLAYLEKQKEQKPIEDVIKNITKDKETATKFLKSAGIMNDNGELAEMYRSEQKPVDYDHEMWKNCEANFEGGKKEVIDHPEKYGLQKEQKPVEWSDDDEANLDYLIDFCNSYNNGRKPVLTESVARSLSNWLYRVRSGEISLPKTEGDFGDEWDRGFRCGIEKGEVVGKNKTLATLSKQEWSEEDEKMLEIVIANYEYMFDKLRKGDDSDGIADHILIMDWLKSLRPQPHWKPSEEQMNCLCAAVDAAIRKHNESVSGYEPARILKSLYEQLKKIS